VSVDLTTNYLGLKLRNPLVISASPLSAHLHTLERLQEAGADVGMLASALIRNGPDHLRTVLTEFQWWMEQKQFKSVEQIKGSLSQKQCANPNAFERANYIKTVTSLTSDAV
jgi:dihydroorotate dehydrogenase (fumarate)